MAQRFKREILPATENRPQIELVRSARRTRTISMQRDGVDEHGNPAYRLLIPAASTSEEIDEHIARLLPRIQRRAARRERATVDGHRRVPRLPCLHLAQKHLPELVASGRLERLSIRWVNNQRQRWGSATYANTQIRISSELQGVPEYALDSVIHHELCHLLQPNHSGGVPYSEARYPQLLRAQAYLEGYALGRSRAEGERGERGENSADLKSSQLTRFPKINEAKPTEHLSGVVRGHKPPPLKVVS